MESNTNKKVSLTAIKPLDNQSAEMLKPAQKAAVESTDKTKLIQSLISKFCKLTDVERRKLFSDTFKDTDAYSKFLNLRIPEQAGHRFRFNPAGYSG